MPLHLERFGQYVDGLPTISGGIAPLIMKVLLDLDFLNFHTLVNAKHDISVINNLQVSISVIIKFSYIETVAYFGAF